MICGLAQTFAQLLLARVGVGIGEAGSVAPAHSLISDYTPRERRASALAIFHMGVPDRGATRSCPRRRAHRSRRLEGRLSFGGGPRSNRRRYRSLRASGAAPTTSETHSSPCAHFNPQGNYRLSHWEAKLCLREPGGRHQCDAKLRLRRLYGGVLSSRPRSRTWRARQLGSSEGRRFSRHFPGADRGRCGRAKRLARRTDRGSTGPSERACLLFDPGDRRAGRVAVSPYRADWRFSDDPASPDGVPGLFGGLWFGPVHTVEQSVAPPHMRATASALLTLVLNLIGLGLGPLLVGVLSDLVATRLGLGRIEGVRWALIATSFLVLPTLVLYWVASRTVSEDIES